MARVNVPVVTFNRGRLSALGLARTDLDRTRLSAETQTNWMPRVLGSMMLRPGLGYIGAAAVTTSTGILIPGFFDVKDTWLNELTSTAMRVWVNDALVTRVDSTAVMTNGTFAGNVTNWTDDDDSGATSEYFGSTRVVTGSSDFLSLVGTRYSRAKRYQTVTSIAGTHGVRAVVSRGRVGLRIGSSVGGDDYFAEAVLRPGTYSLSVVSTGDFSIELSGNTEYRSLVDSVSVESSGAMSVDTTWVSSDLHLLRYQQSADVFFVAAYGYRPKRIERYSTESWAVVQYDPLDGPFGQTNISTIRLTGSTLTGNITLAADQPFFKSGHEGALFQLTSNGQQVTVTVTGTSQFSSHIRVTGAEKDEREFDVEIDFATGSGDGTIVLQRSVGEPGSWTTVKEYDSADGNINTTWKDKLLNQIVFYRIGADDVWNSGTAVATLRYDSGGLNGVVRVESVFSATESSASVLSNLGSTLATELWTEGDWSTLRGWPSAVGFHEGRLWWAGKAKVWGSLPDAYESFDPEMEGDGGVIIRSIATGAVDKVEWLGSLGALIIGAQSREISAKTNSLEAPLTPTNFNLRDVSQQGSAGVQGVKIDSEIVFIQKSQERVYSVGYTSDSVSLTYKSDDVTVLVPEMGRPSIVRTAIQRQPDTRIHCVRSDGTVALLVHDKAEDVAAWIDVETCGLVEDVAVLPSTGEDAVYYLVRREINGSTGLFLEKWAQEIEAQCYPIPAYMSLCVDCSAASTSDYIESITVDGVEILGRPVYCPTTGGNEGFAEEIAAALMGGYDLDTASYSNKFYFSRDIGDEANVIQFKPDGTRFYLHISGQFQAIAQFTMTTPWEITTSFYEGVSLSSADLSSVTEKGAFDIKADGSKLYFVEGQGQAIQRVFQYTLVTPWDIGTASYDDVSVDFGVGPSGEFFSIYEILFSPDGTNVYMSDQTQGRIYQYVLPTAWDIESIVIANGTFIDVTSVDAGIRGIEIKPDGTQLWMNGTLSNIVTEFTFGTAWDIETATTTGRTWDWAALFPTELGGGTIGGYHGRFSPDGCTFYQVDQCSFKGVFQFDLACSVGSAAGPCIVIEAEAIGTCSSEQVVVTTQGDIQTTFSSKFLGGQSLCGAGLNKIADSFLCQESTATATISGADHLVGAEVVLWGNGKDLGTYTVSTTGTFTASEASTAFCYGLPYTALYRSVKLAYGSQMGTGLTQRKRVDHLGFILHCTHAQGIEYGGTTSVLDPLPRMENSELISTNALYNIYDEETIEFPGEWDSDSRIVLVAKAPRPATVLGAIIQMETKEKV